jgi:hypothetical protein
VKRYFPSLLKSLASTGQKYAVGGSGGYNDSKQRPVRDEYLLHSIQRSSVHASGGQGDHSGINVKSDIYVMQSEESSENTDRQQNWR